MQSVDQGRWNDAIDRNYDAFQRQLQPLLRDHHGQYALIYDGRIEGFFASPGLAENEGQCRFGDAPFSIQPVIVEPVEMGYFSYADR